MDAMKSRGNLVLGRRVNEAIVIGEEIVVRVVRIKGATVRIMIQAPREINIRREELLCDDERRKNNI